MAIYHLEAKVVSRGAGRSAVAASAYLSCSRLYNEDVYKRQGLHQKAVQWPFGSAKRRDPVPVPQCHPHGHLS